MINTKCNNVGLLISNFRNLKNITQDDLSKSCGIHRTTLSDIERGVTSPSIELLQKICSTLDIELLQLFGLSSERQSYKIYQPHNGNLGDKIIDNLKSNNYTRFNICVAYAKLSGVNRLKPSLLDFKSSGGEINCFVGIDQCNTTYEALNELFDICDNLYIVHNQNPSHTYHHKIYMFDKNIYNSNKAWLAIGSNNLTAGGLFINYESCSVDFLDLNNPCDNINYNDTLKFFDIYADEKCQISNHVKSKDFIDKLLLNKYIIKEHQSRITKIKSQSARNTTNTSSETLFGKETFSAPPLDISVVKKADNTNIIDKPYDSNSLDNKSNDFLSNAIDIKEDLIYSEIEETFWFEMRKSTGGSRNILDLSSTSKLVLGSAKGTKYHNESNSSIAGSVEFFDICPSDHELTKDIIISFNNNEYSFSTILYASNNKSWRIQLKGDSSTDNLALSQYGKSCFVDNILVFHKITSSYYILEVVSSTQLDLLKSYSVFVASNGISKSGKLFGKLK